MTVARLMIVTLVVLCTAAAAGATAQSATTGGARSAFDFAFTSIDDTPMPLEAYRGKALLVVNVASFCGFTRQYGGLQALWSKYEERGLVVIGVPSNDFHQEPKGEAEIKQFCQGAFNVTFPLTAKYPVRGSDAHPFYRWVADEAGASALPRWNFHKILIGRDGKVAGTFPSAVEPESQRLVGAIEQALGQ